MRKSRRVKFANSKGISLAGIVDLPEQSVRAYVVFAHCFTCTKDLKAIVKISRLLAERGFAVLRFDFTGLGGSGGNFSETTFHDNCDDVRSAVQFLEDEYEPPRVLIGHSLGGAAQMRTAGEFASVAGLVTLASPSETFHLSKTLQKMNPKIVEDGEGEVTIGGFTYLVKKRMLDVLEEEDLPAVIRNNRLPQLIFHSPVDETLSMRHAEKLFTEVQGPRTFVTLEGADHLLVNQPEDVEYVADHIALWASRILSRN